MCVVFSFISRNNEGKSAHIVHSGVNPKIGQSKFKGNTVFEKMKYTFMLIFGFGFIFLMTSLGAALVLFFRKISRKTNAILFAFASGVMIAASVWSLLLPSIEQAGVEWGKFALVPVLVGFIVGGTIFVFFGVLSRKINRAEQAESGERLSLSRIRRLFLSVTLHNIPEGLAVGFAFGAAAVQGTAAAYASALALSIGIGLQNFPEGAAVALPLRRYYGRRKAFLFGVLSGAPEPCFAVLGYFTAAKLIVLQPWFLSFAAGAMLFVVANDLIPVSSQEGDKFSCGLWVMIGFALMMALDVALG